MSKTEKKELREALLHAEKIAVQGIKDVHKITTSAIKDETT
jgi:hypothetical protein